LSGYRLTAAAERDLLHVLNDGLDRFGRRQAIAYHDSFTSLFERLVDFPRLYRERRLRRGVARVAPHGVHVVIYVLAEDSVLILRVRHGREDWAEEDLGDLQK